MIPEGLVQLANHLWQSTLFVAGVWLINLTLRENRAAVRHVLWVVASVKFLIPFSVLAGMGRQFQWAGTPLPAARVSLLVGAIGQPFGTPPVVASPISSTGGSSMGAVLFTVWMFGFSASVLWWVSR